MSDLAAKLSVLQNQKQTIVTQYNEIDNEITAKCNSRVLVFQELQTVERDIVLLEIEQHLDDFASSLQIFFTIELHKILTELNKIATMEEKNRFRQLLKLMHYLMH